MCLTIIHLTAVCVRYAKNNICAIFISMDLVGILNFSLKIGRIFIPNLKTVSSCNHVGSRKHSK